MLKAHNERKEGTKQANEYAPLVLKENPPISCRTGTFVYLLTTIKLYLTASFGKCLLSERSLVPEKYFSTCSQRL